MPARKGRPDANHPYIVEALEQLGCTVQDTSAVGEGFVDLVVGLGGPAGENLLIECKTEDGRLEASQVDFHATWRGPIYVVRSVNEAVELVLGKLARLSRQTPRARA